MNMPLTEKYRPPSLNEISGNTAVVECLKTLRLDNIPNMLFYGPPGTGKTTAIRALLRGHPSQNVLEMNASDSRGIDVVREQIKDFAQFKSNSLKVVVLDEADSMSRDAQNALRRVMEDYTNTRFCIICNFSKKIIEPIASRCTKFRFSPINEEGRIREVCLKEGIPFTDEGISLLLIHGDGDMRKIMNDIQGIRSSHGSINKENMLEFFGLCDEQAFSRIFETLTTSSFDSCLKVIEEAEIDCVGLINGISNVLLGSSLKQRLRIVQDLAEIESRLAKGCSEAIQVRAIVSAFILHR
ncbi:replication factor C subunit 3/5 [Pancytospora epiphaga]|nr:replication factor C subunit 3/5 [Pancytospora epiphaga]